MDDQVPRSSVDARAREGRVEPAGVSALPAALREGLSGLHLPKLDGLRAVAAFLVVFNHYGVSFIPAGKGVLIFFVLSGFLITWLLLKESEATGGISLKKFYVRRSLRIFPAFYAYWVLVTGMLLAGHKRVPWGAAICSFFYVGNYYQGLNHYPTSSYSHTWSLAIEEQFYLLWPALFLYLRRDPRRLLYGTSGIIGLVWVYRAVCAIALGLPEEYLYTAFEMRADHLLFGCLLAILLRGGYLSGFWAWLTSSKLWLLLTVVLIAASSVAETTIGHGYRDRVGVAVNPVLVMLLIPQLIAARGASVRWLDHRAIRYLGTISYPVYLYQQLVISPVKRGLGAIGARVAQALGGGSAVSVAVMVLQFVGTMAAVVIAASASYSVVEKPFLKLKRRFAV